MAISRQGSRLLDWYGRSGDEAGIIFRGQNRDKLVFKGPREREGDIRSHLVFWEVPGWLSQLIIRLQLRS